MCIDLPEQISNVTIFRDIHFVFVFFFSPSPLAFFEEFFLFHLRHGRSLVEMSFAMTMLAHLPLVGKCPLLQQLSFHEKETASSMIHLCL